MSSIISAFQAKALTSNKKNEWVNDFMDRIYNESIKPAIEKGKFSATYLHHHPIPQEVINGLARLGYRVEVPHSVPVEEITVGKEYFHEVHEDHHEHLKHDTDICGHPLHGRGYSIRIKWGEEEE